MYLSRMLFRLHFCAQNSIHRLPPYFQWLAGVHRLGLREA